MSVQVAWRRRPAARALLLTAALFVTGTLYALAAPAARVSADTGTSQQVAEGRKLFAVGCASCHGLNGEGSSAGPVLVGVGAAAVDFQVGTGRMPMARDANQALPKPVQYSPKEIAALAAYVASLGPGPEIPDPAQYTPSRLDASALARGGELFRTNCSACHNYAGAGGALPQGRFAPSLFGVEDRYLYEAMTTGPQQMPVFADSVLTPENKRAIIGYLNTLHEQPSPGGLSLSNLGPVSEGLWGWVVGMGGLITAAVWIAAKTTRTGRPSEPRVPDSQPRRARQD